jgi:membrane-associated phospholipid phosphatase
VAGYWLAALLVAGTSQRFEAWLRRTERSFESFGSFGSFWSFGSFGVREILELAYLCCYPIVPAALLTVYLNGSLADVDRFWTSVLVAGYACYFSLPWLVSRPPRSLHEAEAETSPVRRLNLQVLGRVSHGWNTFPSGHVAVALAAAVAVAAVSAGAGALFLMVAGGITFGSVAGRYHYAVDAVTGVLVAAAAWTLAWTFVPG